MKIHQTLNHKIQKTANQIHLEIKKKNLNPIMELKRMKMTKQVVQVIRLM